MKSIYFALTSKHCSDSVSERYLYYMNDLYDFLSLSDEDIKKLSSFYPVGVNIKGYSYQNWELNIRNAIVLERTF